MPSVQKKELVDPNIMKPVLLYMLLYWSMQNPIRTPFTWIVHNVYRWLDTVNDLLEKEKLPEEQYISWSQYHASMQLIPNHQVPPNALRALLVEQSESVAMIMYGIDVIRRSTEFLNPGQVHVLIGD